MKSTYYFSHDSNARHDIKIQALRSVYGIRGYGMYWIIVEMMRENESYKLPLHEKLVSIALSREFECSIEEVKKFINDCIYEFSLFVCDENFFWSDSLIQRMELAEAKRNANKQNGVKGGRPRKESVVNEFSEEKTEDNYEFSTEKTIGKMRQRKGNRKEIEIEIKEEKEVVEKVFSDEVLILTSLLIDEMKKNNENAKIPADRSRWHNDMKLLIEDGYDVVKIESMIKWCQADDFWKANILSPRKLREKAGTLVVQMGRGDDAKRRGNFKKPIVAIAGTKGWSEETGFYGYNEVEYDPEELERVRQRAREYEESRMRKV